jgi:hypothetical protein
MSPLLDVDEVVVRGPDPGRAEEVEVAAGVDAGAPLATLDLDAVRAAALSVPWVGTATVSRSWPASVVIEVTSRRPVAVALVPDGTTVLVDAERQLGLGTDDGAGDNGAGDNGQGSLPRIVGAVGEARPGARLGTGATGALELAMLLDGVAVGDGEAPQIAVDDRGALHVVFPSADQDVAARVQFGRPVDLDEKVRALRALLLSKALTSEVSGGEGRVIDVRVPRAPVVTRPAP